MTEIEEAAARVRRYVEMRDAKPLRGLDDEIHGIHVGTEWEARITVSDLRAVLLALPALVDGREGLSVSRSQPLDAEKEPLSASAEPSAACIHLHQPPWDSELRRYVSGDWICQFCGHKSPVYP